MNREQVLALSDEEVQDKAAALDGWVYCTGYWFHKGEIVVAAKRPDYFHNIAATWGLVRSLPKRYTLIIFPKRAVILSRVMPVECGVGDGALRFDAEDEIARFVGAKDEDNIVRAYVLAMTRGETCD